MHLLENRGGIRPDAAPDLERFGRLFDEHSPSHDRFGRAELARWVEEGASAYDPKATAVEGKAPGKVFSGP